MAAALRVGHYQRVAGSDADPRRVVDGESFGAPVPGEWPGSTTESPDAVESGPRYGCLVIGCFWLAMIALLWVPSAFAVAWAIVGLAFVVRPAPVAQRLTSGSTISRRSRVVRSLTSVWGSPLAIRLLGFLILAVAATGVLAETDVILAD